MTLGYPSRAFLDGAESIMTGDVDATNLSVSITVDAPYRDPATGELLEMVAQVAQGCRECGGERYPDGPKVGPGPFRQYCPSCKLARENRVRAARKRARR